nr:retrovirus-related Pol polyprotein from transposon 17.6 [Tanacetum cinerariifolium]
MVAYLQKPEGSEEFHQIVDFLNTSHIRYALTENPTIYVSLIQQFWKSATTRTLDNGDMEITATIDGKVKVVTEASVRRHLKLEDSKGSTVPVESHHTPTGNPSTSPPHLLTPPRSSIRQETEVSQPSSPTHTYIADEAASTGVDVRHGGAATTQTKQVYRAAYTKLIIKVKRLKKTVKIGKARRKVQIVVSDDEEEFEDPSKQGRSMIEEIDQDTEVTLVTPTYVSTQGEAHSQPEDQLGVLSAAKVLADTAKVHTYTRRRRAVNTGSDGISTTSRIVSTTEESGSTDGASMPVSTAGMIDKGKGIMKESKSVQTKTKRQQEQKRLGLETAVRLQEQFDEEERQRIARVHEAAQTFTEEEWENIRARVEADEELTQRLQAEERDRAKERRNKPMTKAQQRTYMSNYIKHIGSYTLKHLKKLSFDEIKDLFEATMRSINDFVPMESEDDKEVPKLTEARSLKRDAEEELKHEGSKKQKTSEASGSAKEQPSKEEKELSKEDLQQLMIIVPEQGMNVEALQTKYPIIDWEIYTEDTRKLFEPDTEDELWELQRYMHDPLTWRLYNTCGVHHGSTEKGMDIFMLIEKEYPLSKGLMNVMLVNKLLIDQHSEMANELVRKIFMQRIRRKPHSPVLMEPSYNYAMLQQPFSAEKCHFMVKEGIVLDHKVSGAGIEKIHKRVLTSRTPNDPTLDWSLPFEVMCDASDYVVGAMLGQRTDRRFKPIHYASKTMNEAQENYTSTEKELLAVVFAFNKFSDHLSRLENPNLGKLTKAEIKDLLPKERLMAVSDKNNEPCNVLTESYEGASPEMRHQKSFGNVIADHLEDIMINELGEMRLDAYELSISNKERTKRWHDKCIKAPTNYKRGDNILLFNSCLRLLLGILKSRWYVPFSVSKDMKNDAIELYDEDGNEFIVNKQWVKPYQKNVLDTNRDDDITLDDEGEVT